MDEVATPTIKSRARWSQRLSTPPAMQLTPRDLTMLAHLATHRFLTSEQLARLDGGSEQNVKRCLRALFDHGFVDRVGDGFGRKAYALTASAARLLRHEGHRVPTEVRWSLNNKRAGEKFIDHTLAIADVMIGFHQACRGRGDIEFLFEDEVLALAPEATRKSREPLRWAMPSLRQAWGVGSVVPDGLFGLAFSDETASYFLLELDRGGMPITRKRGREDQTSFERKLAFFWTGWRAGKCREQFGIEALRILTVTTTPARVENMVAAVKDITGGGSNLFLFTDRDRLAASDPLQMQWVTGKAERVRLTD